MIQSLQHYAEMVPIDSIRSSPENDLIYHGVDKTSSQFRQLVESVQEHGIREPLTVTLDGWIISGHRRYTAAGTVGLENLPVNRLERNRDEYTDDEFLKLLADHNTQREKLPSEKMREHCLKSSPKPHQQIIAEKIESRRIDAVGESIADIGTIKRSQFSGALMPFVDVVKKLVFDRKSNWPLSVRKIHYALVMMKKRPMYNSSLGKHRARYDNTEPMSQKLSGVLTRMRIFGIIPHHSMEDETRHEKIWPCYEGVEKYLNRLRESFASWYSRDLMVGQPHHIEIIVEKLTIKSTVNRVALEYTIPTVVARGKASMPPRYNIWRRWKLSGKDKLIVIVLSDHDPDGRVISDMWWKSFTGDFYVPETQLEIIRAGLNEDHVERYSLPTSLDAKPSSPTYKAFVKRYGTGVYEIDALPNDALQQILRDTIESVIDRDAYEEQVAMEEKEAGFLTAAGGELGEFLADQMDQFDWPN